MRIKHNHKGFSLVEILIGVTILAIITVPITHAFVTSARTSAKAQNIRSQTVAAQNVLEAYEATNIGEIIADIKGNNTLDYFENIAGNAALYIGESTAPVTSATEDVGDGAEYRIELENVSNGKYDAAITVKADGDYQDVNLKEIVNAKPMSAVFNQPSPITDQNNSPDALAAKDFALRAEIDSIEMVPDGKGGLEAVVIYPSGYDNFFDYFMRNMNRVITITIDKSNNPKYKFVYTTPYNTSYYNDSYSNFIFSDPYDGTGYYGLYFFYYPNLNVTSGSDVIVIDNTKDELEMNVYLIRQDYRELEDYDTKGNKPIIKLYEGRDTLYGDPAASVFPNYKIEESEKRYFYYPKNDSRYWSKESTGMLAGQTIQNRIYKVTVSLYESDSGYEVPLLTLDASSVE